ncbi:MAG: GNVR domain-containing protein [Candidatus Omnitrophota bacterium]
MYTGSEKKPLDYLKIFFRRKWLVIIPTVIAIALGVIAANALPKAYRASTLILVEEGRIINPLVQGLAVSTSTAQRLAVLREQILGWDRINQLITKLNLAKDVRSQEQFENLVKNLRQNIIVKLRGDSLVTISYDGKDALESQNIVKTITDIFIAENLRQQTQETDNAINFINDQLELYQKKLKQSEISAMQDQLEKLRVDSTEKHPVVVELKKKIEQAKGELEKGIYNINTSTIASSDSELSGLRDDLGKMKEELTATGLDGSSTGANRTMFSEATNDKLYKLLLLERIDNVAARDANVNQRLYDTLLQRLETAKITQRLESSKEGTKYTILDPARLPLKPVKPNKPLVLFMSIFLGICAGAGMVFIAELLDHSFLGIDQAKQTLDLPILGAIPKIITVADLNAQRMRRMKITGLSIITGVVLLVVIIFNIVLG